ncbi:DUF2235 domain-containing protein [Belnapia moabensis]|uniref:DUF2235 domain-containing protein n=1 Tax=Belnapia moabensis TaxID=365533 RepID=UPI0006948CE4|nr:DUF2235 domain-containing protein [Belnapia moabensis]
MPTIPPKRLVICFDGTWNSADSERAETNVARIARAIRASSGDRVQITLYLRGVGTTGLPMQRVIEGATGLGIDETIRSGYMFLAQNYLPGDEIYLFGFSRGAFSARSLAGFLGAAGLLMRQSLGSILAAWDYYRNPGPHDPEEFHALTGAKVHEKVPVTFLGVWDTVGSLGIPGTLFSGLNAAHQFHNTKPSRIIRCARHALAVDEHRDEFVPTLWTGTPPPGSDIRQLWFAGAHSDVGGGYPERGLADISLAWMADEAARTGLQLDELALFPQGRAWFDPLAPQHESRHGWSGKDRLTPTIREVCGREVPVHPWETLYAPRTADGTRLPTINEALHPSLALRYGQRVRLIEDDATDSLIDYRPKNLVPPL